MLDDLRNIADRKYHKALTLTEDMRRKFLQCQIAEISAHAARSVPTHRTGMASYRCARCLSGAQGKSIVNGRLAEPVSGAMKKAVDNWKKLRPPV